MKIIYTFFLSFFAIASVSSQISDTDFTWLDQEYSNVKEVRIYKDSILGVIQQFNKNGKPTFIKNTEFNGDKIIAVWGYKYRGDRLEEIIFGHSNIGFSVSQKIYLENDTKNYSFLQNKDSFSVNTYPYLAELKEISSLEDLENSKAIIKLKKGKKVLTEIQKDSADGKVKTITTFDAEGAVFSTEKHSYKKNYEAITYSTTDKNLGGKIERFYDQKGRIVKEIFGDQKIVYDYANDLLQEKTTSESQKVTEKKTFKYNSLNKIANITTFVADYNTSFTDTFKYNEKGDLEIKTIERIEGIKSYKYEYVYY